jgi:hypothetical protein
MIEQRITRAILKTLAASEGYMLTENLLMDEAALRIVPPAPAPAILENLQFCQQQGWAMNEVDVYRVKRWWITDAGKIELRK